MSESPEDFQNLMNGLHTGSEEAARALFERYGKHVRRVVRRKLHVKLRSKYDSDDFTQAVWASFFAEEPRKYNFDSPEALVRFLGNIAFRKVAETVQQRMKAEKYNVNREQLSLNDSRIGPAYIPPARQDTPSQIIMGREQWDRLLEGQPPHYQQMIVLLSEGHTHEEIAHELNMDERTVRRVIRKLMSENGL